jgi:hypothetical protein
MSFALSVAGAPAGSLAVNTTVGARNEIGLVVSRLGSGDTVTFVGDVPFGAVPSGSSSIRWDLRVNGVPLSPGQYTVNLGIFTNADQPTGYPPAPEQAVLSIPQSGSPSVTMVSATTQPRAASSSSGSGLSGWVVVLIGLGGVAVGLLAGVGVARRRKTPPTGS